MPLESIIQAIINREKVDFTFDSEKVCAVDPYAVGEPKKGGGFGLLVKLNHGWRTFMIIGIRDFRLSGRKFEESVKGAVIRTRKWYSVREIGLPKSADT